EETCSDPCGGDGQSRTQPKVADRGTYHERSDHRADAACGKDQPQRSRAQPQVSVREQIKRRFGQVESEGPDGQQEGHASQDWIAEDQPETVPNLGQDAQPRMALEAG